MVITCPSCSARYRLNPDKIQGRGAKITCPKCSHVFVVFTDNDAAEAEAPRVKPAPRPVSSGSRARVMNPATTTGAFKAVGIVPQEEEDSSPRTNTDGNIRIVAPGTRSARRLRTVDSMEMSAPPPPATADPAPVGDIPVRSAGELDFRSVGIKTWKVKVAIGLIYDFSDIATLKKYLADKKVTPDDLISHNNDDWIRIGEIGDLDQHFIDTWREAKAAIDSGEVEAPETKKPAPAPRDTLGHQTGSQSAIGTGTFRTADTGSSRTLSTSAYGAADSPPKRRRKKAPPEEPPKRPMGLIIGGVALVALVLVWRFWPGQATQVNGPPPPIPISEIKPSDEELAQIRKNIQDKLRKKQEDLRAGIEDEAAATAEAAAEPTRDLIPVPPGQQTVNPTAAAIREPVRQPPGGQYQRPIYQAPAPVKKAESTGEVREKRTDPAKMYYDAGQKKLGAGDYGSAQKMFTQAIVKNAACGKCFAGLAEAEKQLGNVDAATAAAKKAAELGSPTSSRAGR